MRQLQQNHLPSHMQKALTPYPPETQPQCPHLQMCPAAALASPRDGQVVCRAQGTNSPSTPPSPGTSSSSCCFPQPTPSPLPSPPGWHHHTTHWHILPLVTRSVVAEPEEGAGASGTRWAGGPSSLHPAASRIRQEESCPRGLDELFAFQGQGTTGSRWQVVGKPKG